MPNESSMFNNLIYKRRSGVVQFHGFSRRLWLVLFCFVSFLFGLRPIQIFAERWDVFGKLSDQLLWCSVGSSCSVVCDRQNCIRAVSIPARLIDLLGTA